MKRRLNLFSQRSSSKKVVTYYVLARRIALWTFGVSLVVLLLVGGTFIYLRREKNAVDTSIKNYNRYILLNQSFSKEIQRFVFKYNTVQSYMDEDANSFQYYSILKEIFSKTSPEEQLMSFMVNNARETSISVNFSSYEGALQFIEELETPLFQDSFEQISIAGFNVVQQNQEGYLLTIEGIFTSPESHGTGEN